MKKNFLSLGCMVAAVMLATGCSTTTQTSQLPAGISGDQSRLADLQTKETSLEEFEAKLNAQRSMLDKREQQVEERLVAAQKLEEQKTAQSPQQMASSPTTPLLPPDAKPGECYARIFVPNMYKTVTEQVLKREASERIEIIPAKYETVMEKVLVKGPSERLEVVPATYEWVDEQVMSKPATVKIINKPAVFETVTEKVLVREAHMEWKKGEGPIQKLDQATGEIMCLVEEPAVYKTVSKTVLKKPAMTEEIEIPAEYNSIRQKVMKTPPTTQVVTIPAEYKEIRVTRLVEPAKEVKVPVPEQYQTVTKKVKVSDGHMEWRSILCRTNMTHATVSDIQRALKTAGYNPGPIDGVIGSQTMQAVNTFQKDKGLLESEFITMNTLKALNVTPR